MKQNHICEKCGKTFSSDYILQKHINRKISCIEIIICKKCNRRFDTYQHLKNHLNRKNPCKLKENSNIEEQKEVLNYKHNLQLELLDKELELLDKELEIIEAKKKAALEIEEARTRRKEKTAQIINTNITNTQNNIVNNFIVQLPTEGVISASDYKKILKRVLKNIDETDAINLVYFSEDIKSLPVKCITDIYANDKYPQNKNIWYNKDLNTFYYVIDEQWQKANIETLRGIVEDTINIYNKYILYKSKIFVPKEPEQENKKMILESYDKIKYKSEYYDNIAMKAFDY